MRSFLIAILLSSTTLLGFAQNTSKTPEDGIKPVGIIKGLTDSALLDVVQRQTFRYFWDFGHPTSGLARERSNVAYDYGNEVVTTGGSGFGIMALIVADHRKQKEPSCRAGHDQRRDGVERTVRYRFQHLGRIDAGYRFDAIVIDEDPSGLECFRRDLPAAAVFQDGRLVHRRQTVAVTL